MKLLKRMALLSLCVFALSGCTKSSVSEESLAALQAGVVPSGVIEEEQIVVDKSVQITKETDPFVFDWEQVEEDVTDMFMDEDYYPLGVEVSYEEDMEAKSLKLIWVLKDEATDEDAMEYAVELVQQFNNIMVTQKDCYEFAKNDTFGGLWEAFALTVQIAKEDGTMMIDKTYDAGAEIDLTLPQYSGEGPVGPQAAAEENVGPSGK